jgi:hypothetical protein
MNGFSIFLTRWQLRCENIQSVVMFYKMLWISCILVFHRLMHAFLNVVEFLHACLSSFDACISFLFRLLTNDV